jgi:hypothetical protein
MFLVWKYNLIQLQRSLDHVYNNLKEVGIMKEDGKGPHKSTGGYVGALSAAWTLFLVSNEREKTLGDVHHN